MTDTPELLPCPFCGGEAFIGEPYGEGRYVAECLRCTTRRDYAVSTKEQAIELWNTRADHQAEVLMGVRDATSIVKRMAMQKTLPELRAEYGDDYEGDLEYAYNTMVDLSREALSALNKIMERK